MKQKRFTAIPPLLTILLVSLALFVAHPVDAATTKSVIFTPYISLSKTFQNGVSVTVDGTTLGKWLSDFYLFFSGVVGILAAVMVMWGGFKWLTASGNTARVGDAKETIYAAIIAIVLTLGAYVLLNTINPALVKLPDLSSNLQSLSTINQDGELAASISHSYEQFLDNSSTLIAEKSQAESKNCPTSSEMQSGFVSYLSGYYRPSFQEQAIDKGFMSSFACNVAMQCSCVHDTTQTCQAISYGPCKQDWLNSHQTTYCISTKSGTKPHGMVGITDFNQPAVGIQPYTAAADSSCFGAGTTFQISDSQHPYNNTQWVVEDIGVAVKKRHFDLFMGGGTQAFTNAKKATGNATIKVIKYVPPGSSANAGLILNSCTSNGCSAAGS